MDVALAIPQQLPPALCLGVVDLFLQQELFRQQQDDVGQVSQQAILVQGRPGGLADGAQGAGVHRGRAFGR